MRASRRYVIGLVSRLLYFAGQTDQLLFDYSRFTDLHQSLGSRGSVDAVVPRPEGTSNTASRSANRCAINDRTQQRPQAMSAVHWIGIVGFGLLVAFVVFAFRQGMKVRPLDPDEQPPLSRNVGLPG